MTTNFSFENKVEEKETYNSSRVNKKSTGKRKFHKKSRKGCTTCKKRRVKCDESRPICGNCERMGIECVYQVADSRNSEQNSASESASERHISSNDQQIKHDVTQSILPETPKEIPPITPLLMNASSLSNFPMSPISQFLQQLPQSPTAPSAAQVGVQFLNNFPPEVQAKLFQQFAQLPPDKQQQLYQSLPMVSKAPNEPLGLNDDLANLAAPFNDILNEFSSPSHLNNPPPSSNANISNNDQTYMNKSSSINKKVPQPTPTPQELAERYQKRNGATRDLPNPLENMGPSLSPDSIRSSLPPMIETPGKTNDLNMLDLRLMYHYTTKVWPTITAAGISDSKIWSDDIPMLAFKYPFLMHSVLAFSATHLSRNERGLDQSVTCHRAEALRLLGEAVLEMSPENTDALVAAALILIMDSLANASLPTSSSIKSLPPSAWIFHVKGAATILTAVWPLSEKSRFYKFISVELGDLGEIGYDIISGELSNTSDSNENSRHNSVSVDDTRSRRKNIDTHSSNGIDSGIYHKAYKPKYSSIECFDEDISDLFPVPLNSPYFPTLAYMAKLYKERNKSDFILRIFAFPALLDKRFLGLLINCDLTSMRIMRCYYRLLRNFTEDMKEKVWFLEGVSSVLPADVEQYAGGGGMHMMLDFLGGPSTIDDDGNGENYVSKSAAQSGLLDTNNLPSASITHSLGLDDNSGLSNDD
ncbi:hypothetical protein CANINC_001449 [Pichia inconspicua]|uniref:Zn(2)-C6 fungal-type domain-containing protein n=1 Tax=Pichia inconspicua TaxID=52247 RepID=A0A4T0X3K9_9ASCO|nr:hypothetical protein CANINC_001449 [[Candida] inconspicua]